jgi:hypothetical protein
MSTDIETLLISCMNDEVAEVGDPLPELVARAVRADQRRTVVRRTTTSIGTLGVAAGLAVALTVTATGNRSPGRPADPGVAQGTSGPAISGTASTGGKGSLPPTDASPKLRLIAALTTTDQTSYRLQQSLRGTILDRKDLQPISSRFDGVFDPARSLTSGVISSQSATGLWVEVRRVGNTWYVHDLRGRRPWTATGKVDALTAGSPTEWSPWTGKSAGAGGLLSVLRDRGTVSLAATTGSGAAAVDIYAFAYDRPDDGTFAAEHVTGTISVHRESNLIARFAIGTTTTGHIEQVTIRWRFTATLSDYGLPVQVQVPAGAVGTGSATTRPPGTPATPRTPGTPTSTTR